VSSSNTVTGIITNKAKKNLNNYCNFSLHFWQQAIKLRIISSTFYTHIKVLSSDLAMGARLLSFNRTQSRVVTGLLTGHNTLRRHLHIMGLCNDSMYRKYGTEEETSVHILCECEALASLRHAHLGSLFLESEDIRELGMGANWNFAKGTGLL
jgi:hypothetical protein